MAGMAAPPAARLTNLSQSAKFWGACSRQTKAQSDATRVLRLHHALSKGWKCAQGAGTHVLEVTSLTLAELNLVDKKHLQRHVLDIAACLPGSHSRINDTACTD
jgi:hypothetical protein